ncbi:MAG: aconitate hydratase, partial [Planctomycetota bacterium]|nr:aconitate hydratase [Planctomycetota bacterium]
KKQGVLPLTFAAPADYEKVLEKDRVSTRGLAELRPGSEVRLVLRHADGGSEEIAARHTLTAEQVEWLKAGSSMAWIGARPS